MGRDIPATADTLLSAISGVAGIGTLVVLDFQALMAGTSAQTLGNVLLFDSNGNLISNSITNGSVTVTGGTVVTPEPSSLMLIGTSVLSLIGLVRKRIA